MAAVSFRGAGFSAGAGTGSLVALTGETLDEQWDELAVESGEPARQADCVAGTGSAHVDAFVGIGGLWLAGITRLAMGNSLVPIRDPRLDESLRFENA